MTGAAPSVPQALPTDKFLYFFMGPSKGEMRRLWIQRINAACRSNDMSYSRFIAGLNAAGIEVDRKILADLAVTDPAAFAKLVDTAKSSL